MSDLMLFGVLRMPYEMAMSGEISRIQFYDRAQQAADRIEKLEAELAECRRAAPSSSADELPPLPQPMRKVYERPHGAQELFYFTAEQMRDYARAAFALGRGAAVRDYVIGGSAIQAAAPDDAPTDLPKRLRIKAGMITMGEKIAWGSDSALMLEAAEYIERRATGTDRAQAGEDA